MPWRLKSRASKGTKSACADWELERGSGFQARIADRILAVAAGHVFGRAQTSCAPYTMRNERSPWSDCRWVTQVARLPR